MVTKSNMKGENYSSPTIHCMFAPQSLVLLKGRVPSTNKKEAHVNHNIYNYLAKWPINHPKHKTLPTHAYKFSSIVFAG